MSASAQPQRAFVALGSNLGDRLQLLEGACDRLYAIFGDLSLSQVYETQPVGCPEGSPAYLNACVAFYATCSPQQLLQACLAIEAELGRSRTGIYGEPRPCDCDLICYGEHRMEGEGLVLPHPRAHQRAFVLQPLVDIEPGLILPGQSQSGAEPMSPLRPRMGESDLPHFFNLP